MVLDFQGVRVMSSSFADEVFGRLFVRMGAAAFMSRIRTRNANRTIAALIDRAILLRSKADNGEQIC